MKPICHSKHWHPHRRTALAACAWLALGIVSQAALADPKPTVAPASMPAAAKLASPSGHAYRCKLGNGASEYSQLPCSPQAELIKASDARTASQIKQSVANDKQEVKLAAQMARERRHEERVAADAHAQGLTHPVRQRHASVQGVVSPGSVTPRPKTSDDISSNANSHADKSTYKPHRHRHFKALVPKSTAAAAS